MKILVVGSMRHLTNQEDKDRFVTACKELGEAIGRARHDLVIGSNRENTADKHVVDGLMNAKGRHQVWVIRPEHGATPFTNILAGDSEVIFSPKRAKGYWSTSRVSQILAADAVILIGGADGTKNSGEIAPALERPALTIASFEGAAKELWNELESYYRNLGKVSSKIDNLREAWQTAHADLAVRAVTEMVKRRTFKTKARLPLALYVFSIVALLASWVALFAQPLPASPPPTPPIPASPWFVYSFFLMLFISGLLGSFLRNSLRMAFDPTATFSWSELLIEVTAGLILGFALALLYFVGALTITGDVEVVTGAQDAQRVAVVMTLLGLGGGLMIEQAAERVRQWYSEKLGPDT